MVNVRIIIGTIILIFGIFAWLNTLYGNIPIPNNPLRETYQILNFDIFLEMLTDSIIIFVGSVILIWGTRSRSSNN